MMTYKAQVELNSKDAVGLLKMLMKVYTAVRGVLDGGQILSQLDWLKKQATRGENLSGSLMGRIQTGEVTEEWMNQQLPKYNINQETIEDAYADFKLFTSLLYNINGLMRDLKRGNITRDKASYALESIKKTMNELFNETD